MQQTNNPPFCVYPSLYVRALALLCCSALAYMWLSGFISNPSKVMQEPTILLMGVIGLVVTIRLAYLIWYFKKRPMLCISDEGIEYWQTGIVRNFFLCRYIGRKYSWSQIQDVSVRYIRTSRTAMVCFQIQPFNEQSVYFPLEPWRSVVKTIEVLQKHHKVSMSAEDMRIIKRLHSSYKSLWKIAKVFIIIMVAISILWKLSTIISI